MEIAMFKSRGANDTESESTTVIWDSPAILLKMSCYCTIRGANFMGLFSACKQGNSLNSRYHEAAKQYRVYHDMSLLNGDIGRKTMQL